MTNRVRVISIYVPNLNKAIEFYTNTLGFELNNQYGFKIATLVHGDIPFVLEERENTIINEDNQTSRIVIGFETDDIEETIEYFKEKNVNFIIAEPEDCPPGKFISFKDPFGNTIEYYQFTNV